MDTQSDSEVVRRAARGSPAARETLFRRHWRGAWQRAFAITGREALAEDVAQDAFLRAFERLDDLEDPAAFGAWLARIVARRAIDVVRREARTSPDEPPEPPTWIEPRDDDAGIRRAVAGLGPERRVLVVMRYWLDMTPPEIADALELPVGTVHSRLARALAELRSALEAHADA